VKIKFAQVKREHVIAACKKIIAKGVPVGREGRTTFVKFEGHSLLAKYVLGSAYQLAHSRAARANDHSGGAVAAKTLSALGFKVLRSSDFAHRGCAFSKPSPRILRESPALRDLTV